MDDRSSGGQERVLEVEGDGPLVDGRRGRPDQQGRRDDSEEQNRHRRSGETEYGPA